MSLPLPISPSPPPLKTLLLIFLISLALRFWNLGQFNQLVFDEVYYAKFANNYLTGTHFFNVHPPLSQYLIAIGIWLASHFPADADITNNLTGSLRSTISYRWLNALTGSFIPIIVGLIAYQLTYRRNYTIIAALFAACEGLFLVESRYALNNIYLVFFGLLGQLYFLISINKNKIIYLTISGLCFGLSASVKWNGLGFLLGIYLLIFIAWQKKLVDKYLNWVSKNRSNSLINDPDNPNFWSRITNIQPALLIFNLTIVPIFIYSLLWLPHLLINPEYDFFEVHQKSWSFHQRLGNNSEVHPYCSPWYTWVLMIRPMAYFYKTKQTEVGKIIYDVHGMGNPLLWWLSTAAIFSLLFLIIIQFFKQHKWNNQNNYLYSFILINYASNLLPWIGVSRCTFIYYYMGSYIFSWLALAWIVNLFLASQNRLYRRVGITIIILAILAFIFWMPIYLGMPLSQFGFNLRMFLPNWI
ncbi:glycosyl transferase family 39 [Rippkaea orientalis PCC 8801]|uniref:Polyprenol-phosphate-mannose--protein mannosyltransferase n=1 Tax=Rippkaea orientalis (strain PCC 8801 / RF-1) TaxID=41431 RepID=B7K1D0_RIPO1|nr:phospholipid carrier-dependent glycosyltransferase [Rippkaea orientalis]ACK66325.1 glycosyl transferase family 39 [Rippkaea orientalis PCC 8801]